MAKKKEPTVEEKLRALYDLQLIDSRIDKIRDIRGELPLEVRDLEDEIEGLNKRIEKLDGSLKELDDQISAKKNLILSLFFISLKKSFSLNAFSSSPYIPIPIFSLTFSKVLISYAISS